MTVFKSRSLAFGLLLAALPTGFVLGAGGGAGAGGGSAAGAGSTGGGVGAAGMGSAAVGGGAPAGRVGGGPPAGAVGGGAPGSINPTGNGAAGTGNPALNAAGGKSVPSDNPASGLENAPMTGDVIGGNTGVPPATGAGPRRSRLLGKPSRIRWPQKRSKAWPNSRRPRRLAARSLDRTVFPPKLSRRNHAAQPRTRRMAQRPAWGYQLSDRNFKINAPDVRLIARNS